MNRARSRYISAGAARRAISSGAAYASGNKVYSTATNSSMGTVQTG